MDGLRFYPFCPLTSLQAATCQTARPRSLSWEYKQRADDRASIISPALLPSGTFVPPHLFLLLSFSRFASPLFPPISPLRFRFTPPSAFRLSPSFSPRSATIRSYSNLSLPLSATVETWRGDLHEILIPLCQLHSRSSRA